MLLVLGSSFSTFTAIALAMPHHALTLSNPGLLVMGIGAAGLAFVLMGSLGLHRSGKSPIAVAARQTPGRTTA